MRIIMRCASRRTAAPPAGRSGASGCVACEGEPELWSPEQHRASGRRRPPFLGTQRSSSLLRVERNSRFLASSSQGSLLWLFFSRHLSAAAGLCPCLLGLNQSGPAGGTEIAFRRPPTCRTPSPSPPPSSGVCACACSSPGDGTPGGNQSRRHGVDSSLPVGKGEGLI